MLNVGASIGRVFFPALPAVPDELMQKAADTLEVIGAKSSVEDYACIAASLEGLGPEDDSQPQRQVGAALRQLAAFLKEADPVQSWGGLELVQMDGDTDVIWVCKDCIFEAEDGAPGSSSSAHAAAAAAATARCKELEQLNAQAHKRIRALEEQLDVDNSLLQQPRTPHAAASPSAAPSPKRSEPASQAPPAPTSSPLGTNPAQPFEDDTGSVGCFGRKSVRRPLSRLPSSSGSGAGSNDAVPPIAK